MKKINRYKKYIAFGYDDYYPCGGMLDIQGSADTIEEAKRLVIYGNVEIVDRDTWGIVYSGEDYLEEICARCGCTYGSHHSEASPWPKGYCPGREGRMDWENGPGTVFKPTGRYKN